MAFPWIGTMAALCSNRASAGSNCGVSLLTSAGATVATLVSLALVRTLSLPAPISSIAVLLSTIDPLTLAWQRFAGTTLGGAIAALLGTLFHPHCLVYATGIFVSGILSLAAQDWAGVPP